MSEAYLAAVRRLPSCISGRSPCIAHHLRCAGGRGVGWKSEDRWALPLTLRDEPFDPGGVQKFDLSWFPFAYRNGLLATLKPLRRCHPYRASTDRASAEPFGRLMLA